ncbi:hypothetical protein M409DRAFT_30012 [Zasmidium cellare ATCC 36951]|uniref:RTA1 like protein n=1 Tax=Zasmidium cellare ATCC 36951 TaxID=1080233 RepID=A0A6A6BXL1_ZASCE|nr:uncharacterized protein M409DRAFT_30012 [Zasmidium cellare ATCC 36951]KAF2159537.1 hypothetical protein M409DRAFT_30012 [Zasmidium cellare ATCC 36951]
MAPLPDDSAWFYYPNTGAAAFFSAFFGLLGVGISFRAWQGGLKKFYWVELIGVLWEVAGFAVRAAAHDRTTDVGLFAAQQSLIVLAPLWIAGGIYLICGRIMAAVSKKRRIFGIPVRRIALIFVTCDIVTLLVQVSGTSIAAGVEWEGSQADVGSHIITGGLAAQTVTLVFFIAIIVNFAGARLPFAAKRNVHWLPGFRSAFWSSLMILLRCVYRLIEFAMGVDGYLFEHEWPFYVIEALPMAVAVCGLALVYPPHYLQEAENSENIEVRDAEMS